MRTEKQKLANWTELVHPGENVEIEKGVISASGSGGSGGGGVKIVNEINNILDTTFEDIKSAFFNGMQVILHQQTDEAEDLYSTLTAVNEAESGEYEVVFGSVAFITMSADGYPAHEMG